jgi:hypothetical protein
MNSQFYDRYKNYDKERLFRIALTPEEYEEKAIETAMMLIAENGWLLEFGVVKEEDEKRRMLRNQNRLDEIHTELDHSRRVVEIKNARSFIQLNIADAAELDQLLTIESIDYLKEETNNGVLMASNPTFTYYFKKEDKMKVNTLYKELGLSKFTLEENLTGYSPVKAVVLLVIVFGLILICICGIHL